MSSCRDICFHCCPSPHQMPQVSPPRRSRRLGHPGPEWNSHLLPRRPNFLPGQVPSNQEQVKVFKRRMGPGWAHVTGLSCWYFFLFFFLVRKIVTELISVPIFFYFLYVGCHHNMAWWAVHRSVTGIWTSEPRAAKAELANLTITPTGEPLCFSFKRLSCYKQPERKMHLYFLKEFLLKN